MVASSYRPHGLNTIARVWSKLGGVTELPGHQFQFAVDAFAGMGHAMRQYRKEVASKFTELTWGSGAVIVGGGVAAVMVVLGLSIGAMIAIFGYNLLGTLGAGPLAGMLTAVTVTRELGPIMAAVGFAIQAGCRITAEVGSMRIAEEIDALEAQGIRPIPYVVSTRLIAGMAAILPIYVLSLALCFWSAKFGLTTIFGQPGGSYTHYFDLFINGRDIVYSLIKVVVFVIAVTIAHSYYGFYATGGPEGVGVAAGRAIRASLVLIVVLDMVLTLGMWGIASTTSISFSG